MPKIEGREVQNMYIPFNPNPEGKMTDDCVIRAVAKVLNIPWEKAYMNLSIKGLEMSDMPNNNAVWGAYLREKKFVRETIPNTCPDCYTVEDFCRDNPTGVYVLGTGTHAVAVIDGNYYDAYPSGDKTVFYAYRKE